MSRAGCAAGTRTPSGSASRPLELRRFPVDVLDGFTDLGQIERPRFQDVGDSVVVLAEYKAKGGASGPEVATSSGWLFEVRDGRIARGRGFVDQRQALEAVGLQE
jgi:ketosteroid isomerase-like protein